MTAQGAQVHAADDTAADDDRDEEEGHADGNQPGGGVELTELAAVPAVNTMATSIVEQSAPILALDLLTVGAPDVVRMRALAHFVANLRARGHPNAVAAIDALDALTVFALKILGTGALAAANATVAAVQAFRRKAHQLLHALPDDAAEAVAKA